MASQSDHDYNQHVFLVCSVNHPTKKGSSVIWEAAIQRLIIFIFCIVLTEFGNNFGKPYLRSLVSSYTHNLQKTALFFHECRSPAEHSVDLSLVLDNSRVYYTNKIYTQVLTKNLLADRLILIRRDCILKVHLMTRIISTDP